MVERSSLAPIPIVGQALGFGEAVYYAPAALVSLALAALSKLQQQYLLRFSSNIERQYSATINFNVNLRNLTHRIYNFVLAIATILWVGGIYRFMQECTDVALLLADLKDDPTNRETIEKLKRLLENEKFPPAEASYRLALSMIKIQREDRFSHNSYSDTEIYKWLKIAADQDHLDALYIAIDYLDGMRIDIPPDLAQMKSLALKGALQGHYKCQIKLGFIESRNEQFLNPRPEMRIYWMKKAAESHVAGKYFLAIEYLETPNDQKYQEGMKILEDLANNNYLPAQSHLAYRYYTQFVKAKNHDGQKSSLAGLEHIKKAIEYSKIVGLEDSKPEEDDFFSIDFAKTRRESLLPQLINHKDPVYSYLALDAMIEIAISCASEEGRQYALGFLDGIEGSSDRFFSSKMASIRAVTHPQITR